MVLFPSPRYSSGTRALLLSLWILCPSSSSPVGNYKTDTGTMTWYNHGEHEYLSIQMMEINNATFLFSHSPTSLLHLRHKTTKETWLAKCNEKRKVQQKMWAIRNLKCQYWSLPWITVSRRVLRATLTFVTVLGSQSSGLVSVALNMIKSLLV